MDKKRRRYTNSFLFIFVSLISRSGNKWALEIALIYMFDYIKYQ